MRFLLPQATYDILGTLGARFSALDFEEGIYYWTSMAAHDLAASTIVRGSQYTQYRRQTIVRNKGKCCRKSFLSIIVLASFA
jgi:hypothetical protein